MSPPMSPYMSLPTPGLFAVSGSTTYRVLATGQDWLNLQVDADSPRPPHRAEGEDRQGRRWLKVSKSDIQRYYDVAVTVEWRGESFLLGRLEGDRAEIHGTSPVVADRLGMSGDQYNGFRMPVPVEELTVLDVRETDIPT